MTLFKLFIWGGIWSDIRPEILFYVNLSTGIYHDLPPQMKILNMVVLILMYILTFTHQKHFILCKTYIYLRFISDVNLDVDYHDAGIWMVYNRIYCC